ncbi:hypothetical protein [Thioalkalivibrio sp. ALE23]|uniref:hypothetical protein n=1 Tax=Thioalkalivibrio sp. ALE23 TaxID=1265495 RepID=UPI0012DE21EE|nr:hypothetical protein [Thioalkalivibrio sp. ALE23]
MYINYVGKAAYVQADTHGLIGKCVMLRNSGSAEEIDGYFEVIERKWPNIQESDAIVIMRDAASGGDAKPKSMGVVLKSCLEDINERKRELGGS